MNDREVCTGLDSVISQCVGKGLGAKSRRFPQSSSLMGEALILQVILLVPIDSTRSFEPFLCRATLRHPQNTPSES